MTKHERKILKDACFTLFDTPTPANLIALLLADPGFINLQREIGQFIASPTTDGLNHLVAVCRSIVSLHDGFCRFKDKPTPENTNELLSVLPSLDADGRAEVGLAVFLTPAPQERRFNVRLDLTLKLWVSESELRKRREAIRQKHPRKKEATDAASTARPDYGAGHYLTEHEARRIASRMMNSINGTLFGSAARRTPDPRRLHALICQHDKGTRRHLAVLLVLPPEKSMEDLERAVDRACRQEPFVYAERRLEPVRTAPGSITYNANDAKSRLGDSLLYIYPQRQPQHRESEAHHHEF